MGRVAYHQDAFRLQGKGGSRRTACSVSTGSDREICKPKQASPNSEYDGRPRSSKNYGACSRRERGRTNRVAEHGLGVVQRRPEVRLPLLLRAFRRAPVATGGAARGGCGGSAREVAEGRRRCRVGGAEAALAPSRHGRPLAPPPPPPPSSDASSPLQFGRETQKVGS